jgi:hypothetical protein
MRGWILTITAAALAASTPANAWNARGHMTVAAIAWQKMDPAAKRRAIALVKLNPDYSLWMSRPGIDALPETERDRIAFMEAATWPDDLKQRVCSNAPTCIIDEGYTPADAEADQNIGYRDRRLRRYWHFKNLPFSTDGTPTRPPFRVNAETQIGALGQSLAQAGLNQDARSFNLVWLLHLVGDVHQPLHATARFTADDPRGDAGGNGVIVCRPHPARCVTRGRPDSLHGLWDDAIGTSPSATSAARKADDLIDQLNDRNSFLSRVVASASLNAPVAEWMTESLAIAKLHAYAAPIGAGRGPHFPDSTYRNNAGSIAEQRIVIAGLRLANLLNDRLR